ncbi:hypothetical protein MJ904_27480 [Massilia sp. MB5]|uniref:darcynin family protein n=1 Tax=unclassified Massilia TaxID=2609279 RepID=UPI00067D18F8|nr:MULTISPECIES: darcynin family protein [unclassified Massilia]UMR30648.1 hypothetical protein MJ904_27480 [Massilia sp. MB5]
MSTPKIVYSIVMCYTFSNEWLHKPPGERRDYEGQHIFPILIRYGDRIKRASFDAEAFTTSFSDFMILETEDLSAYYFMMEELRASPMLTKGYVTISNVIIGINNEYKQQQALL